MHFTKMHGIGNDYVVVEDLADGLDDPGSLARAVADRHRGIGCDGLIVLSPPRPGVAADVRMRMLNPDGSEAEMCGNGIRCACKYAYEHGLTTAAPMRVETAVGALTLDYRCDANGRVTSVTVDMGAPVLDPGRLPVRSADGAPVIDRPLEELLDEPAPDALRAAMEDPPAITCVSMGNPHAVLFCRDVGSLPLDVLGPWLEHHAAFPNRINAHFVRVDGRAAVTMRTWERGAGPTLACGTGACAVVVAAALTGRAGRAVTVRLPGGELDVRWDEQTGHLLMTGPATEVFAGDWSAAPVEVS